MHNVRELPAYVCTACFVTPELCRLSADRRWISHGPSLMVEWCGRAHLAEGAGCAHPA